MNQNSPNTNTYKVSNNITLLDFLFQHFPKTKAKIHLKKKRVFINGKACSQFNFPLQVNDKVEIRFEHKQAIESQLDFKIIYEDKDIIAIDKPAGLLSIASNKEYKQTALTWVNNYLSQKEREERAYAIHRLEREMSGLMIMAKSHDTKVFMQDNWNELVQERFFMAIVEGKPEPWSGELSSYLKENKGRNVYVTPFANEGHLAVCRYKLFKSKKQFSLLRIEIEKAYKHQIRVQLSDMGFPVVGDSQYGSSINPINRIALHAFSLKIKHPYNNKVLDLKCDLPKKFLKLI